MTQSEDSDSELTASRLALLEAAITSRRSIKQFLDKPVPRSLVERLIDLAVWAPNHRLTEPWRFYVLDGASRLALGEIAGAITRVKLGAQAGADPGLVERKAGEAAQAWARVPVLVYVTVVTDPNPEIDRENYGATCCAIQNLMLAAPAAGLGTSWSSGAVAAAPDLHALAGAGDREQMVGLIRVGYPDPAMSYATSRRAPGTQHTTWVDGPPD